MPRRCTFLSVSSRSQTWWYQGRRLNVKTIPQRENSFRKERVTVKSVQVEEEMPGGST